jgi:hypothetical protein
MTIIKIRREEIALVQAAGERLARRNHSRFVIDQNRVEVADDENSSKPDDGSDSKKPLDLR